VLRVLHFIHVEIFNFDVNSSFALTMVKQLLQQSNQYPTLKVTASNPTRPSPKYHLEIPDFQNNLMSGDGAEADCT
jgi:hypothetical protein